MRCLSKQPTVTKLVQRMAEQGWVALQADASGPALHPGDGHRRRQAPGAPAGGRGRQHETRACCARSRLGKSGAQRNCWSKLAQPVSWGSRAFRSGWRGLPFLPAGRQAQQAAARKHRQLVRRPLLPALLGPAGQCPAPLGPLFTVDEQRREAHYRIERGTSCWLAGKCKDSNAYRYDKQPGAAGPEAALRRGARHRAHQRVGDDPAALGLPGRMRAPRASRPRSWSRRPGRYPTSNRSCPPWRGHGRRATVREAPLAR